MVEVVRLAEKKEVKCHQCKSVLRYGYGDINYSLESDYGGDRESVARIKCPVCGSHPRVPYHF